MNSSFSIAFYHIVVCFRHFVNPEEKKNFDLLDKIVYQKGAFVKLKWVNF